MKLFLAGDVMTGRGIDQILRHPVDPVINESYMKSAEGYVGLAERRSGPIPRNVEDAYVWGDVIAALERTAPDVRIVNLETAVTAGGSSWPDKGISYRMHPANVGVLHAAAIDVCSLANNHVLDWSYPGLTDTLDTLDAAGIGRAGAGRDRAEAEAPAIVTVNGARVVVPGIGFGTAGVPRAWAAGEHQPGVAYFPAPTAEAADAVARHVDAIRAPDDVVVLSVHWGPNWGHDISRNQTRFAHQVIEAGVDIVHGHSSHHAKALEVYQDRLIMYGCGDLINDYEGIAGHEEYRGDLGVAYLVTMGRNGLEGVDMAAFQMHRFRAGRASTRDVEWLAGTLDDHSRRFGTHVRMGDDVGLEVTW